MCLFLLVMVMIWKSTGTFVTEYLVVMKRNIAVLTLLRPPCIFDWFQKFIILNVCLCVCARTRESVQRYNCVFCFFLNLSRVFFCKMLCLPDLSCSKLSSYENIHHLVKKVAPLKNCLVQIHFQQVSVIHFCCYTYT